MAIGPPGPTSPTSTTAVRACRYPDTFGRGALFPGRRGRLLGGARDRLAHRRVRLHVLHPVVVHDPEVALTERLGHGAWHLGLGLDDARPHLLLERDGHGPPPPGLGLGDLLVGG